MMAASEVASSPSTCDGEGALTDPPRSLDAIHGPDGLLERWRDDAALERLLPVGAEDEHGRRLLPDGSDEARDQPVLQRLLGEDEEDEQPDRADEQPEPGRGSAHLPQGEVHHLVLRVHPTPRMRPSRPDVRSLDG